MEATEAACFHIGQINALLVTAMQIENETRKNVILSKILQYVRKGWPGKDKLSQDFQPYLTRQASTTLAEDTHGFYGTLPGQDVLFIDRRTCKVA